MFPLSIFCGFGELKLKGISLKINDFRVNEMAGQKKRKILFSWVFF